MYRTCIFCSGDLGANDSLEEFPVGRMVAFDGWKGRLWAVCSRCGRWNLAPIEERWEAIEAADRLFTDARLRVQSENVGMAKLRDGTRLIRIGQALPGELAAWRYGDQLVDRRRRYLIGTAAVTAVGLTFVVGLHVLVASAGGLGGLWSVGAGLYRQRQMKRELDRIAPGESPTGQSLVLRHWHVRLARLAPAEGGGIELHVPDVSLVEPRLDGWGQLAVPAHGKTLALRKQPPPGTSVVLPDPLARRVLGKAMVGVNEAGASRKSLQSALGLLSSAPSAEEFLRLTARVGTPIAPEKGPRLGKEQALALEMALHEETERRAMEGELAVLEAAWREAEEIAEIADALPDDPLDRLRPPGEHA